MVPPPTRHPSLSQTKQLERLLRGESRSTLHQERIDAISDRRRSEGAVEKAGDIAAIHILHTETQIYTSNSRMHAINYIIRFLMAV